MTLRCSKPQISRHLAQVNDSLDCLKPEKITEFITYYFSSDYEQIRTGLSQKIDVGLVTGISHVLSVPVSPKEL